MPSIGTLENFVSKKTSGHTVDTVDGNIPAPKGRISHFSYVTGGAGFLNHQQ